MEEWAKCPENRAKKHFLGAKGVDWVGFGGSSLQETEMEKLETLKDLSRSVPIFSK